MFEYTQDRDLAAVRRAVIRLAGLALALFAGASAAHAAPAIEQVEANTLEVTRYAKLELTVALRAEFANPYDPSDVRLYADFTGPDGHSVRVEGFRYQPFNGSGPSGAPVWKIRFSPSTLGAWTVRVACTDRTGTSESVTGAFQCAPATSRGFVRTSAGTSLFYDDGGQFFAVGENVCWWQSDPVGDYRKWIDRLAAHGGNYIRIWMASWSFSPEWTETGLGNYDARQLRAHYLDQVLDYAEAKGVYVQLCLLNHGQFSARVNPEWDANPYNAARGGPCRNPWEFFTNATAKTLVKQRFRYVVARWSYSPALLSWELFNEVDLTDEFSERRTDNAAWHRELAAYLKEIDPNRHLVTTSYATFPGDASVWGDQNVDYAQIHHYDSSADQAPTLYTATRTLLDSVAKPVIVGEFGFPDPEFSTRNDPDGVNLHNTIWASTFSGALGTASTWWWESYVDPRGLYRHYGPPARLAGRVFSGGAPPAVETAEVRTSSRADLEISPGLTGFVRPPENAFTIRPDGTLSPSTSNLCRFLYAARYHPELFNPPTFTFEAPAAGTFKVSTGPETGESPRIAIYLDGVKVLEKPAKTSKVYAIDFPAGPHTILVTNLGLDWITIDQFAITNFVPGARSFVLRGQSVTAGWLANRAYTWRALRDGNEPSPIADAVVRVGGLQDGSYTVEWRSCRTGDVVGRAQAQTAQGVVELAAPAFAWDLSFELRPRLPSSDVDPPVVSDVVLSKKKVRRSIDPTVDVTWRATDMAGIVSVGVQFAEDGEVFVTVLGDLPADATSARWTVPTSFVATKRGAVRVIAYDAAGNEGVSLPVRLKVQ